MDRRNVIKSILSFGTFGAAFTGFLAMGIRFITPVKREIERRIFTLHLNELPINSTQEFQDLRGKDLVLVRTGEQEVKAISTACTHLGCSVYWHGDKKQFHCPCHQAVFDKDGKVVSGPPPRALDSYRTEIQGNNVFIYFKDKG